MFLCNFSKRFVRTLRLHFYSLNENVDKCKYTFHTNVSVRTSVPTQRPEDSFIEPFDVQVEGRHQQAQKSLLVQVHSELSCAQLHEYCLEFGNVTSMHHYTIPSSSMHFILVEFSNREIITEIMKFCGHSDRSQIIPTHSRMLWFRASQNKNKKSSLSSDIPLTASSPPVVRSQLLEWLGQADSVSDQIMILYKSTKMDDLGIRLRYVTAYALEAAVLGLFPRARVHLFGSSVNGFGRQGCDLDLLLQLDHQLEEEDAKCRLMFHTKPSGHARSQTQRHIDGLGDLIQWFLPGCVDVRRILLARVPIVKYRQEFTDMECDLSLTNMVAVYMSELLYMYGAIDWRLRPLVFTVKRWAAEVGLTNPSPGRWITNFSLTLLVIFYLQKIKILPSLDTLRQKASKSDRRMAEDGVNCTFLRDPSKLKTSDNKASLESLLIGCFEYYAAFDFATQGIALGTGKPTPKRDHAALYIVNPLEPHLNVSQNVSLEELERLRIEFRNAAWELESFIEEEDLDHSSEWGLLRLFRENKLIDKAKHIERFYSTPNKRTSSRLVPISKLFEDEPQKDNNKNKSSTKLENTVVR